MPIIMDYVPRNFGDSLTRGQTKSTWLLALSFIPLVGLIFAIIWGLTKDVRGDGIAFHWGPVFPISDYSSLNTYLTIIGIFHSFVAYCIHEIGTRAATVVRTRAFRSRTSLVELLNDLPGSPYWQRYFKSNLTWRSVLLIGIFYPAVSTIGGVLYKQALVLSTFNQGPTEANYTYTFVTGCTNDITNCLGNRYLKFGVALRQARFGGAHSMGVETTESGRRLTFVAAPTTARLTSVQRNITSLRATSLAMVGDFRNVISDETLPAYNASFNVTYAGTKGSLLFHGTDRFEWSFSARQPPSGEQPYQIVGGMTQFCVVECEWTVNGTLSLQNYTLINCAQLDLSFWRTAVGGYAPEIGLAVMSDLVDESWDVVAQGPATHPDVLQAAYVVPAMYSVLVLGGWGGYWEVLKNNTVVNGIFDSPVMKVEENDKILTIETKPAFMIPYLILLSAVFIAHVALGFFIQKTYVTEWAPLWIGLLTDLELKNIRQQIRDSDIFESKGLKQVSRGESSSEFGEEAFLLSRLFPGKEPDSSSFGY